MGPSEAEVVARLTVWGEAQEQIRALLLTSSRTNPAAPLDGLSDYDVVVVVTNLEPFSNEETWPEGYGTPLVRFRDAPVRHGSATRTRLVVYDDGVKIDYQVWPVELVRSLPDQPQLPDSLDVGYRVLLDKDGVTERAPAADVHGAHPFAAHGRGIPRGRRGVLVGDDLRREEPVAR